MQKKPVPVTAVPIVVSSGGSSFMSRWVRVTLLIASVLCVPLSEALAQGLSAGQIDLGRSAFQAAASGD